MSQSTAQSVELHRLVMIEEPDAWVVGRPDAGDFVALPVEAVTFIKVLQESGDVGAAEDRVHEAHGVLIDSEDFIVALLDLGYVAILDGELQPDGARSPSLPRVQGHHVRWLFSPLANAVVLVLMVAGLASAAVRDALVPSYQFFFVFELDGVNLAVNTSMFLLVVAVHEFNHLAAARAEGVHARVGLGTRLTMLAATTTVAGMWAASRRSRFRVYLAGIRFDVTLAAVLSLSLLWVDASGVIGRLFQSLQLAILMSIIAQFAIYMRTDIYFVLQEALRCKNLYSDSWAYLRHIADRRSQSSADPTSLLPRHEQRRVRLYACLMLIGSLVTLASFAFLGGPILVTLMANAANSVASGIVNGDLISVIDGTLVFMVEGTLQIVFIVVFVRKHHPRIGRLLRRRRDRCRKPAAA